MDKEAVYLTPWEKYLLKQPTALQGAFPNPTADDVKRAFEAGRKVGIDQGSANFIADNKSIRRMLDKSYEEIDALRCKRDLHQMQLADMHPRVTWNRTFFGRQYALQVGIREELPMPDMETAKAVCAFISKYYYD